MEVIPADNKARTVSDSTCARMCNDRVRALPGDLQFSNELLLQLQAGLWASKEAGRASGPSQPRLLYDWLSLAPHGARIPLKNVRNIEADAQACKVGATRCFFERIVGRHAKHKFCAARKESNGVDQAKMLDRDLVFGNARRAHCLSIAPRRVQRGGVVTRRSISPRGHGLLGLGLSGGSDAM